MVLYDDKKAVPVRGAPQELVKGLIQPITNLSETSIGAGFVLFAGRRATDTDAANDLVSDFDWHAAADSDKLPIVERRIEGPRHGDLLGQFSRAASRVDAALGRALDIQRAKKG